MGWAQMLRIALCAVMSLQSAGAMRTSGCREGNCSTSPASPASPSPSPPAVISSQDFLGQFTQVQSKVGTAVRTEEPASWAVSVPALRSSPGGAVSTTPESGGVGLFLMVNGSKKAVLTAAVSMESCTASLMSFTMTVMTRRRWCVGTIRRLLGASPLDTPCCCCCSSPCWVCCDAFSGSGSVSNSEPQWKTDNVLSR
ncbi:teratocarcinoma-derived growth factor 1 isoform X2 [Oryzias melastigma]|uniref:teratocarcinoma-derived growth factor 1 isoform X2 n=1 Tax=Oryzias melastigma TaxID=30732 RepID=UPI000CF82681|nr:teratocarcinoma-derived growth factor 1 isoform X2 [Oryzias melastigma]